MPEPKKPVAVSSPSFPPADKTLFLIDISSFIFRAFYAIRILHNAAGEPTNAVYGVATMLARLAEEAKPANMAVVYDSKEPSFRKEIFQDYKAHRTAPPDDLIPQFVRIEQLISAFEIHTYRQSGMEADDLIATLAKRWSELSPEHSVVIVTGDKDLMQLVDSQVMLWDTMSNRTYRPDDVFEKMGVRPHQIQDYLGLMGDSSDNIPGVPGIGPKTAKDLLSEHGNLENILTAAKAGMIPGKKGEILKAHEADARLSARLATVRTDLPVEIPLSTLKFEFRITSTCIDLLKELDFQTLAARWMTKTQVKKEPPEAPLTSVIEITAEHPGKFETIHTERALSQLVEHLEKVGQFAVDVETTSLNPRAAKLVGISISHELQGAQYIPVGHSTAAPSQQLHLSSVLEKMRPVLENPKIKKIGQNLKYDYSVLREQGIVMQNLAADTMVADYLADPDSRHNLETLSKKYLNHPLLTYAEVCGQGKNEIGFDQVSIEMATRYSGEDAWAANQIWNKVQPVLAEDGLLQVFNTVEMPLVEVLARMELTGVCVDVPYLNELSQEFGEELKAIETRIQEYAQGPVNLNSPKQLSTLLFEQLKLPVQGKTKTGFSTDAQVLDILSEYHEVPSLLIQYREISKLKGTYIDPLPMLRDPKTGRIHTTFHQTVAATGRLSSSDPNLQNIPIRTKRGTKIRRAFIPAPHLTLLSIDYSQIELRLLAHMSGDPELVRAFSQDEDVHAKTASDLFGVSVQEVNSRQRGIAKAINFGLMYGKSAFGLSQELKIPRKEAQDIIQQYFRKYSAVKNFLDQQITLARDTGEVRTLLGRRRKLPDIHAKNAMLRGNAERMAMNTPLQGTAADLMKLAMIEMDRRLIMGGYRSRLLIQVHDEVVLECPEEELPEINRLVSQSMVEAMSFSVPLRVNSAVGQNWMDLQD